MTDWITQIAAGASAQTGSFAGLLLLGFLMGLKHAFEADHIAAVSSIASRESSMRRIVTHGAAWGMGHTLTLMLVAGGALLFGVVIGPLLSHWLEGLVGVMLVYLGMRLLLQLRRARIHAHLHRHGTGPAHWHFHSHAGETSPHDAAHHRHTHARGLPIRTLLVGMMHGLAGSAALMVLTATTVTSPVLGLGYILIFGIGSILGMMTLSAFLSVPLTWSARALGRINTTLQGAIGVATVVLGLITIYSNALAIG